MNSRTKKINRSTKRTKGKRRRKKERKISEQFSNSVIKSTAYKWPCYRLNGELRRGSVCSNNTVHRHRSSYPVAFPIRRRRRVRLCRSFATRSLALAFTTSHKSATKFRRYVRSHPSISASWKRHFTTAEPICFPSRSRLNDKEGTDCPATIFINVVWYVLRQTRANDIDDDSIQLILSRFPIINFHLVVTRH